MAHLRLVKSQQATPQQTHSVAEMDAPLVGKRYTFDHSESNIYSGSIIGDYKISLRKSDVIAPVATEDGSVDGYFWQNDLTEAEVQRLNPKAESGKKPANSRLLANRAILQSSKLVGPNIMQLGEQPCLTVSPEFIIHFHTAAGAATLGEIRLIDTSRFITLESGKTIPVICTDPAEGQALLLTQEQSDPVMAQPFVQPDHTSETYVIRRSSSQYLPKTFRGENVVCVTVLEHVTSYFMQKLCSETDGIWTPVIQPISWGWSVKAEKAEQEWEITKRKVMRPTIHHGCLQLPGWSTHVTEPSLDEWKTFLELRNPAFDNAKNVECKSSVN